MLVYLCFSFFSPSPQKPVSVSWTEEQWERINKTEKKQLWPGVPGGEGEGKQLLGQTIRKVVEMILFAKEGDDISRR